MNRHLIYDVGMHNGDDSAYYLFRGYRVVAIEASPALCGQASERFGREIAEGRLTVLNVAVADRSGPGKFWQDAARSRVFPDAVGPAAWPTVDVQYVRFRDILRDHGVPYYLKIDIEGQDIHCLRDLDPADTPEYLSVEAHSPVYLAELYRLGYRKFKCVLTDGDSGLGALPGWQFKPGTSGPFGEDVPGAWLNFEDTIFNWVLLERGYWKPCTARARLLHRLIGALPLHMAARSALPPGAYDFHAAK